MAQQRPQLADRRLVGGDLTADVRYLLRHVLRLLSQRELGADTAAGQLRDGRLVLAHGDLELDGRRGAVRMAGVRAGVLVGHVAAGAGDDDGGLGDGGGDVRRPDGQLRGVDELLSRAPDPLRRG
jgi:hypothetical protein